MTPWAVRADRSEHLHSAIFAIVANLDWLLNLENKIYCLKVLLRALCEPQQLEAHAKQIWFPNLSYTESLNDELPNIFYSIICEGNLIGQLRHSQMSMKVQLPMLK